MSEMCAERLRSLFHYDPETGAFTRLYAGKGVRPGVPVGHEDHRGYRRIGINGVTFMAHRLAWLYVTGSWPTHVIDHINGNPADNRFANLRDVTPQVNTHNQRRATKGRKTGSLLGAQWIPAKQKWRAVIKHNSRVTYVGLFGTEQEAHAAYVAAKRVIHKEGCTL